MDSPEVRVQLALAESQRLGQYIDRLPADAWSQPTACKRWDIRDMVAHLVLGTEFQIGMISRGLKGESSPPEGFPPAGARQVGGSGAEASHNATIARRDTLGDRLPEVFAETFDNMDRLLAGLGASEWDKLCYHPGAIVPVRSYVDLRLMELFMHSWDIRSRLESEAHLATESLRIFMDLLCQFVGFILRPGSRISTPLRFRFELGGPLLRRTDIVVEGGRARIAEAAPTAVDATFSGDTESFVLLMWGRESLDAAIAEGRMSVDGDKETAAEFAKWAKGF